MMCRQRPDDNNDALHRGMMSFHHLAYKQARERVSQRMVRHYEKIYFSTTAGRRHSGYRDFSDASLSTDPLLLVHTT